MKKRWIKWFTKIVLLFLLGSVYFYLGTRINFSIPCLFHSFTHLYCPGCGMTRAVFSLISLDFVQAFFYNPFVYVLVFIIFYSFGMELYYLVKKKMKNVVYPKKLMYVLLVLLLIFGVLRNIPGWEFLLPHTISG